MLQPLGDKDRLRELMRMKVPWSPQKYFAFQSVPQVAKNNILHITFLDYEAESYHGQGIYLHDAVILLKSMKLSSLLAKTVEVRPKPAGKPAAFGWQADGAMINSALCFALTSLTAYAVLHPDVAFPQALAWALGHIPTFYKKHDTAQARFVSNLVESAAQRFASRPAHDPFFLSQEFERHAFDATNVKGIVKLYRQKTMLNGALAMPQRVGDAVVKLMSPSKVADGTKRIATHGCAKHGWDAGPVCLHFLLDPAFALVSQLWLKPEISPTRRGASPILRVRPRPELAVTDSLCGDLRPCGRRRQRRGEASRAPTRSSPARSRLRTTSRA